MNHQTNPLMMMILRIGHSGCCSRHSQLDEVKEGEGERGRGVEGGGRRRGEGEMGGGFKL